jgi:hypothetical protein
MQNLEIPQQVQIALAKLHALTDELFDQLLAGLREAPVGLSMERLTLHVARAALDLSQSDIRQFLNLLVFGYCLASRLDFNSTQVAERLSDHVSILSRTSEHLDRKGLSTMTHRLAQLLAISTPVNLIAKAEGIWQELPRRLNSARLLTDIRPIFGDDVTERPAAALIVHTISLSYCEGSEEHQFHVSLDTNGLSLLEAILERARRKEQNLEATLRELLVAHASRARS